MLDIIAIRDLLNIDNQIGVKGCVYNGRITKIIRVFNNEEIEVEITFSDGSTTIENSKSLYIL